MSPGLKDKTLAKVKKIIARYPKKDAALLPVLHVVQQEFGGITPEEEKLTAQLLEIPLIRVREVVTFYTMFFQKPLGKYHIQMCSNLSCSMLGAEKLLVYLQEKLGIEPGETSPDQKFTLSTVECLGACEEAPCMMVNFDYYGNLDKKKIDRVLDKCE